MGDLVRAHDFSRLPTADERPRPAILQRKGIGYTTPIVEFDPGRDSELDEIARNKLMVAELAIVKRISEALNSEYPGNPFKIACDIPNGVAYIWIPLLMGWADKYVIHLTYLASDPTCKIAIKFAGEILERYGIRRGAFSERDYVEAVETVPKFLRGTYGMLPR